MPENDPPTMGADTGDRVCVAGSLVFRRTVKRSRRCRETHTLLHISIAGLVMIGGAAVLLLWFFGA